MSWEVSHAAPSINPLKPLVNIVRLEVSRWNRYRVSQPLSLMVLAPWFMNLLPGPGVVRGTWLFRGGDWMGARYRSKTEVDGSGSVVQNDAQQ